MKKRTTSKKTHPKPRCRVPGCKQLGSQTLLHISPDGRSFDPHQSHICDEHFAILLQSGFEIHPASGYDPERAS